MLIIPNRKGPSRGSGTFKGKFSNKYWKYNVKFMFKKKEIFFGQQNEVYDKKKICSLKSSYILKPIKF